MKTILIGTAAVTVLTATLAWAAARPSGATLECLTAEDVALHAERSRNGISPLCNERIRLRNAARERSR